MKFTNRLLLLFVFLFAFTFCSDDSTSPDNGDFVDYFPLANGAVWEYESFEIIDGEKTGESVTYTIECTSGFNFAGKDCFMLFSSDDYDTTYARTEGSQFLALNDFDPSNLNWVAFADLNKSKWTPVELTVDNEEIETGTFFTGTIKYEVTRTGTGSFDFDGQTYETYEFYFEVWFTGEYVTEFGSGSYEVNSKVKQSYAKGLGLVKTEFVDGEMRLGGDVYPSDDYEDVLISYTPGE